MADSMPFLFHLFTPDDATKTKGNINIKNFSFIKLPSVTEPSKCVLYHYEEETNQLYMLQKNYYNPKIESILHEKEKINKNSISLFINNYAIENENSYACFPIDAIFLFISIIYENNKENKFMTLEDYLNNFLKNNTINKKDVTQNTLAIFNKNVNKIKERLKNTCDEMWQNNSQYFKPNWDKIKNFYNLKCITLYNYIVENKIVFSDYAYNIDKEILKQYDTQKNVDIFNIIKESNKNVIDKYNEYKTNMSKLLVQFNDIYYKIDHLNLKTFTWLIVKGFMCTTIEEKLIPTDITENLKKIEEDDLKKKSVIISASAKVKKHGLPTPKNQRMIESFFKRKKIN